MELVKPASPAEERALLQLMLAVVTTEGTRPMGELERLSVLAIARHVFGFEPDLASCPALIPDGRPGAAAMRGAYADSAAAGGGPG
ncbi:MAG: hypothetical protein V4772_06715 [Pseudomonadota bacterium]